MLYKYQLIFKINTLYVYTAHIIHTPDPGFLIYLLSKMHFLHCVLSASHKSCSDTILSEETSLTTFSKSHQSHHFCSPTYSHFSPLHVQHVKYYLLICHLNSSNNQLLLQYCTYILLCICFNATK